MNTIPGGIASQNPGDPGKQDAPVQPDKNIPVKPDQNPDPTKPMPGRSPEKNDPTKIEEPKPIHPDPTRIDPVQ